MKELNHQEVETVSGGIIINPWTVMIAVRAVQIGARIAAPYAANFAYNAAAGLGAFAGYRLAMEK